MQYDTTTLLGLSPVQCAPLVDNVVCLVSLAEYDRCFSYILSIGDASKCSATASWFLSNGVGLPAGCRTAIIRHRSEVLDQALGISNLTALFLSLF